MKNPDEAIERVLAGLRETEAPAGMERRILEAVEASAATRAAATPRWVWGMAFGGMIAACLFIAITAVHRHGHQTTQAKGQAAPEKTVGVQQEPAPSNRPIEPIRQAARSKAPRRIEHPVSDEDAVLLSEMRAPSHPAPQAPLTNEERLLLRAVHLGDPQVIAMLNPEVRAREEAESEAEFQRFVNQSGKGDSE
jgi:hypothetical protein